MIGLRNARRVSMVLCAYLRMPWAEESGGVSEAEKQVRSSIAKTFSQHLAPSVSPSWSDQLFNLRGARLIDLSLEQATFKKRLDLSNISFEGECTFDSMTLANGGSFSGWQITGSLALIWLEIGAAGLRMRTFSVAENGSLTISVRSIFYSSSLQIEEGHIAGTFRVISTNQTSKQGSIRLAAIVVDKSAKFTVGYYETMIEFERSVEYFQKISVGGLDIADARSISITQRDIDDGHVVWARLHKVHTGELSFDPHPRIKDN